jgi:mRNA interferase MazF
VRKLLNNLHLNAIESVRHFRYNTAMDKDFNAWNQIKQRLDAKTRIPTFNEREIWWCSIGVNVGHEQNGKGSMHNRPVLILRKFSARLFWGVPLTTQIKQTVHYHPFTFEKRKQCAMLTHVRLYDAQRITHLMGRLNEGEFTEIKRKVMTYLA